MSKMDKKILDDIYSKDKIHGVEHLLQHIFCTGLDDEKFDLLVYMADEIILEGKWIDKSTVYSALVATQDTIRTHENSVDRMYKAKENRSKAEAKLIKLLRKE